MDTVEMPNRLAKDLVLLIRQNDGKLALRRRTKEFAALTDEEVVIIEQIIQEAFKGGSSAKSVVILRLRQFAKFMI
jgi:hypothetical protein